MNVYLSKFTYEYDDDGNVKDVLIGLNGMNGDQFTDSQLKITAEELPDGQSFDTINNQDLISLARQKLIGYINRK